MKSDFIQKTSLLIKPDPSRVLIKFFVPGDKIRITRIIARVMSMNQIDLLRELNFVNKKFRARHYDIDKIFLENYFKVKDYTLTDIEPTQERKLLIGAYFTSEFALESAAIFNPSIVVHPKQDKNSDSLKFILSLRAVGEGHTSSIEFRTGEIKPNDKIIIHKPSDYITEPEIIDNPVYDKHSFNLKLFEMGFKDDFSEEIFQELPGSFSFKQLNERIKITKKKLSPELLLKNQSTLNIIKWISESNYEIKFNKNHPLDECAIFPSVANEKKGIEDARFVKFTHNKKSTYYATYTAFDGKNTLPQLIETEDFNYFRFITLNGKAVQNKGMALFPKKIKGNYAMLSRQDNESMYIMFSDNIHYWQEKKLLMKPTFPWEYVQLGNCGSPIEVDEGWLVITHGVGAMRRYCLGASLLDKKDPSKVIGRLKKPLLEPDENEREGYVPNVVYSCGAIAHNRKLFLPYAMSDYATSMAVIDLNYLLNKLLEN